MLDIEEFRRKRKRVFDNKDKLDTLPNLKGYIDDLEYVVTNERNTETMQLLEHLIKQQTINSDIDLLFRVLFLHFVLSFSFVDKMEITEKTINDMQQIYETTKKVEHQSRLLAAKSLVFRLKEDKTKAKELMKQALKRIESQKENHPEIYYDILYGYTNIILLEEESQSIIEENFETCLDHYYNSYNMLGLVTTIFQLLKHYMITKNDSKFQQLIDWIEEKKIQNQLLDDQFIVLYYYVGIVFTMRSNLTKAIDYLDESYKRIDERNLKQTMMYEYTDILKFLSRCYAYEGKFDTSYLYLEKLVEHIESDFVRKNFYPRGIRIVYLTTFSTLLFIFVQLGLDIENIENKKLREIYESINSLLSNTPIAKDILDEDSSKVENYFAQYKFFMTQTHSVDLDKDFKKTQEIRDKTFEPLYADISIAQTLLKIGKYDEFKKVLKRIVRNTTDTKAPILRIWKDFLVLIRKYIENPRNKEISVELEELEFYCKKNNFFQIQDNIKLYRRLISTTRTINQFNRKIKQLAMIDIYDAKSKQLVIDQINNLGSNKNKKGRMIFGLLNTLCCFNN